jgi:hypothetical protein
MKFLCVPCDSPMKLQSVSPPDRGSLAVVYTCPECGYEMAMLTNAYETQVVQSLGVKIGQAEASAEAGSKCPFTAMIPTVEGALHSDDGARSAPAVAERGEGAPAPRRGSGRPEHESKGASDDVGGSGGAKPPGLEWTPGAEARLANIPEFVRPMARTGIEKFARDKGVLEVDENVLDAARDFFGM